MAGRRRTLKILLAIAGLTGLAALWDYLNPAKSWIRKMMLGESGSAPGVISSTVRFTSGQDKIEAFVCRPTKAERFPAVIVIHEVFGLVDHVRDVVCRFAREGYVGIAPDLYSREGGPGDLSTREGMMRAIQNLPDRRVLLDLDSTVSYLKSVDFVKPEKIGVVGFCMGGLYSLLFAGHSRALSAAVVFYGRIVYPETNEKKPVSPIDTVPNISSPLLGIYGEADTGIPVKDVELLRQALQRNNKIFEIEIYTGTPHAFFNDTRPSYKPDAARDAWEKTLAFYRRYLS